MISTLSSSSPRSNRATILLIIARVVLRRVELRPHPPHPLELSRCTGTRTPRGRTVVPIVVATSADGGPLAVGGVTVRVVGAGWADRAAGGQEAVLGAAVGAVRVACVQLLVGVIVRSSVSGSRKQQKNVL